MRACDTDPFWHFPSLIPLRFGNSGSCEMCVNKVDSLVGITQIIKIKIKDM